MMTVDEKAESQRTAKSSSNIIEFLNSFDSKILEGVKNRLSEINNQASTLISTLQKHDVTISNEQNIITDLTTATSILNDPGKDPVTQALAFGMSFGSTVKMNKASLVENSLVKERVSKLIYDYIEIAKLTSDTEIRNTAINMATAFLQIPENIQGNEAAVNS